jgi:superfamily I DNA/RNA helicase
VNYTALKGLTKEMAQAAFYRDVRKDYKKAQKIVENAVREMTEEPELWETLDEDPESDASHRVRLALWRFTKSPNGLPSLSENGTEWIENLKVNLTELFATIGITSIPKMGLKIKRTGLDTDQLTLPLFRPETVFPSIRQETIHQVKGESIDGILVLGSTKFFNSVVQAVKLNQNTEERRLAYVAMTRARHTLLIGLPTQHYNKHVMTWKRWGFRVL